MKLWEAIAITAVLITISTGNAMADRVRSPEEEAIITKEANPSAEEVDLDKYKQIRKSCIEAKIINTGATYEQWVKVPPPSDSVIPDCNHQAYIDSKKR